MLEHLYVMDGMFDPRNKVNTRRDLVWKDFHFLPKSKNVHCSQRLVVSHPSEECDGCKSDFPVDWVPLNSHNKRTMYDRLNTERELRGFKPDGISQSAKRTKVSSH